MNTPEPCDTCEHCKWDWMHEDDPNDSAWCGLGTTNWGNIECPQYKTLKNNNKKNNNKKPLPQKI